MDNNNFKVRIIDFYKDVDKPLIQTLYTDETFKNILELSTVNDVPLLKKEKDTWTLKDKSKILKEIDNKKKLKIKEMKNNISKVDIIKIQDIKESNNKILSDLESMNILRNNIENEDTYVKIQNLTLLSNGKDIIKKKGGVKNSKEFQTELKGSGKKSKKDTSIKIINIEEPKQKLDLKDIIQKNILSSDSENYIEIFSN